MAQSIITIKKRSTYLYVKNNGKFISTKSFNIQILQQSDLNNEIAIGYTATKRLGNAVTRNRAKRRMKELARKVITKYGKINSYYVLIAKNSILTKPFKELEMELENVIA
jgi:ribonuclease P protein component